MDLIIRKTDACCFEDARKEINQGRFCFSFRMFSFCPENHFTA